MPECNPEPNQLINLLISALPTIPRPHSQPLFSPGKLFQSAPGPGVSLVWARLGFHHVPGAEGTALPSLLCCSYLADLEP